MPPSITMAEPSGWSAKTVVRRAASQILAVLLLLVQSLHAGEAEELWLDTDIDAISEGKLRFLTEPPERPVHHIANRFKLSAASLETGWLELEQCHHHLDPVPDSQILYRYREMRGLRITSSKGIGRTWIDENSVQMQQVRENASLCIGAEVKLLRTLGGGLYQIENGPFYRRFLDGYYPMRVDLTVEWPEGLLRLYHVEPKPQPGFQLHHGAKGLGIKALFEGKLTTRIQFERSTGI